MKKIAVIGGSANYAKAIVEALTRQKQVVFIKASELERPGAFNLVTEETELIVIDQVKEINSRQIQFLSVCDLFIDRQSKEPLIREMPDLILIQSQE